jgi:hypothetical protein
MPTKNLFPFLRATMLWLLLGLAVGALPRLALAQPLPPADPDDGVSFRVLSFHDVRTGVRASFEDSPDETAIDDRTLAEVFAWLQYSGYHPVSLQQIVDARASGKPLPARPVLLTFDDGYRSAYTKVFPLLKRYNYPALFALVTSWLEVPEGQQVHWGDKPAPRENFLLWREAAEMARSGLVEFASHSDAMHTGIQANPQGNMLPAAATHRYDPKTAATKTTPPTCAASRPTCAAAASSSRCAPAPRCAPPSGPTAPTTRGAEGLGARGHAVSPSRWTMAPTPPPCRSRRSAARWPPTTTPRPNMPSCCAARWAAKCGRSTA